MKFRQPSVPKEKEKEKKKEKGYVKINPIPA